jgi:hypothetical protein
MRYHYDLHIHSCLSPCSDDDMTPNNIVNMSVLKGLDFIAVADHNSVDQVRVVKALGEASGLVVVPAMELCTAEEIHLLCLFPSEAAARTVAAGLYEGMAVPGNRPDIFGHQWVLNAEDAPVREEPRMLLAASGFDVEAALAAVRAVGGVVVPAHVDRDAYSIEATLGFIPPEYGFRVVEASKAAFPLLSPLSEPGVVPCLTNSDAHHLWDISEPEHDIDLSERSVGALLNALRQGLGLPLGYRPNSL